MRVSYTPPPPITFVPHPLLHNGHAQTFAGALWLRRVWDHASDQTRIFEVEPGVRILARCRWHENRSECGTLILVHGLGGSCDSPYVLEAAKLAYRRGANVVRMNQRNCGGTEHLTPTLYHSGMSGDVAAVVRELIETDGLGSLTVGGFSMGGNLALKMAGEMRENAPPELQGVCAVSPALDLAATVRKLEKPTNLLYELLFARELRQLVRRKKELYPRLYDISNLDRLRTVRDFDEMYTAPHGSFADAGDYYARSSAIRSIGDVRIPTLIIHAKDDPFVPFEPLLRPAVSGNSHVTVEMPPHGGHVAFVSDDAEARFWAEETLARFCEQLFAGVG